MTEGKCVPFLKFWNTGQDVRAGVFLHDLLRNLRDGPSQRVRHLLQRRERPVHGASETHENVVAHRRVEVGASQGHVPVHGHHLDVPSVGKIEHGHVQGAPSEVVHQDVFHGVLVGGGDDVLQAVGYGRGHGLVEDAGDVVSRVRVGGERGGPGILVELGRNGDDDGVCGRVSQIRLGHATEVLEDQGSHRPWGEGDVEIGGEGQPEAVGGLGVLRRGHDLVAHFSVVVVYGIARGVFAGARIGLSDVPFRVVDGGLRMIVAEDFMSVRSHVDVRGHFLLLSVVRTTKRQRHRLQRSIDNSWRKQPGLHCLRHRQKIDPPLFLQGPRQDLLPIRPFAPFVQHVRMCAVGRI
mmetsp:Transcript_23195/g.52997  ORF Transcript_23195/g.52997 Transcript_23195/m.52997 type:complete len:351 (+) Transcript_23195:455-1507(+)